MSEHYPCFRRYRVLDEGRFLCLRESVCIVFYMQRTHRDIAQAVLRSLEVYLRAVGPQKLGWYVDDEGEWQPLDEHGWAFIRSKLLGRVGGRLWLSGQPDTTTGHEFSYVGRQLDNPLHPAQPAETCAAAFWLPTEYLEEHGPQRVHELALGLAELLPFDSGHTGLGYLYPEGLMGMTESIREACFRYPGLDIIDLEGTSFSLGTRVQGVHWLTFLGPPVLEALGGASGLRSRLRSPDIGVQPLGNARAVVTLGPWPQAGDVEQGHPLPHYRELARALEPWLHLRHDTWRGFTHEDMRRWQRRFLD